MSLHLKHFVPLGCAFGIAMLAVVVYGSIAVAIAVVLRWALS
jgi:hypothetical protein